MKFKRTLFSAFAALALTASVMTPVAMAQPSEDSTNNGTTAEVTVADNGTFDVYFNSTTLDLTDVTLSALTPNGTATGTFRISYIDTLSSRPNFNVNVNAQNFTDGGVNSIAASGFEVTHTYNVQQFQWDGGNQSGGTIPHCGCDIGDIGYFKDGTTVDQNSDPGGPDGHDWTPGATNLGSNLPVQFGYAGVGTHWSFGDVDVALDVPISTVPGTYTSEMTLSVVAGTQP